ncbi:MAG TPA: NlpC/P60 family protein [Acidimicrobiales bacterium]|jgi:cell wall-associated NlpC family hydrolase|nr:NlpC/P60 family protein [Acidimicrobiales bacterium]
MGRRSPAGKRTVLGLAAVGGLLGAALTGPANTAYGSSPATSTTVVSPSTTTTTTLPPIPNVPPADTNGQPAGPLLSSAIALASLGVDDTALTAAVDGTQAKLDKDALTARQADSEATVADRAAAGAQRRAAAAEAQYRDMASAVQQAVIYLYTTGADPISVSPRAGSLALYAQDYAESTLGPYGVLSQRAEVERAQRDALSEARRQQRTARQAASRETKALADQQTELRRLETELSSVSSASAEAITADHAALATQAGTELLSDDTLQFNPKTPIPAPVATTPVALTWAFAELGQQYVWGATGPKTFDCSGLTQFVWKAAGVSIPRVAADQDSWTIPVPLSQLLPGDLVFFGRTDVHHVGIYIGDGLMINAPHTGTVVQVSPIWWSDLAGFGRVHAPGTPVPAHNTPSPKAPAPASVIPTAGPVPSQTKPPKGWKPKPGETTPIALGPSSSTTTTSTTSTSTTVPATTTTVTLVPADTTTTTSTIPPDTTATETATTTSSG